MEQALVAADDGEVGAVAAMVTLLMSVRSSAIVSRTVRDLDDDGHLLWVRSQTPAGTRTVKVPPVLRPYLLELAKGKESDEPLFGYHCYERTRRDPVVKTGPGDLIRPRCQFRLKSLRLSCLPLNQNWPMAQ